MISEEVHTKKYKFRQFCLFTQTMYMADTHAHTQRKTSNASGYNRNKSTHILNVKWDVLTSTLIQYILYNDTLAKRSKWQNFFFG